MPEPRNSGKSPSGPRPTRVIPERDTLNRLRELREQRGLTQSALAEAAGITRQSVNAIEAGRAVPGVDVALNLARALDGTVETLFQPPTSAARLWAEPAFGVATERVALSHIAGRWVSYPLAGDRFGSSADAIVASRPRASRAAHTTTQVELELLRPGFESRDNLVLVGCAPALGLLADRSNATPGAGRVLWFSQSSATALSALSQAHAHVAGVHLVDGKTGEANVADVRREAFKRPVVLLTLASWEAGLLLAPGNPKRISRVSELARKGLRAVGREPGSGARRLLESQLKEAGLPLDVARKPALHAAGHLDVARAVALGAADFGVATRDAASAYGLAFVPLAEERYDLVVARDDLDDPRLVRLFEVMTSALFRRELASLGYDVSQCGARVAEISAA